jgi:hypothetical protein
VFGRAFRGDLSTWQSWLAFLSALFALPMGEAECATWCELFLGSVTRVPNGSRGGIAGVYQRHDWAAENRAALDAWAAQSSQRQNRALRLAM